MIIVDNVSKTYGLFGRRTRALDGVSLEVRRGETLGLIGPNGAGKTTLLSCLLGFLRLDSGSITVDGKTPDDLSIRARTGYMPERLGFDRDLSGRAFLAHHWRLAGGDPARTDREIDAGADRVGLDRRALTQKLRTYSRGMLQRIGVAQAIFRDPDLLFLDEPASGTDPLGVAVVRDRILEAKNRGATIVLNSHQLAEVERVCDRVVFLSGGRLTRTDALRGEQTVLRSTVLRIPPGREPEAVAVLSTQGFAGVTAAEATIRLPSSGDAEVARAVRALSLAEIPVFEVRSSAELEELFRESAPS